MKKTKILATLGPSSCDSKVIRAMIDGGMDAVRINTSHGDISQYDRLIRLVRGLKDIPIILDTQGPEIRVLSDGTYSLDPGDEIEIGFRERRGMSFTVDFYDDIRKGDLIFLEDGMFKLEVMSKGDRSIRLAARSHGKVSNRVRANIPGLKHKLPILSKDDESYMAYGMKRKVDYVALSYTRTADDVNHVRKLLKDSGIGIISKIENQSGVQNFDDILKASDGIMVARGDLGVELSSEKLPLIQKSIIRKCNQAGKLVITATQMLQSMISSPVPTRAETSDVANAILDGTDVVMLSGETAVGMYPVESVKEMSRIASEVESSVQSMVAMSFNSTTSEAMSKSVHEIVKILPIDKIVTLTRSGYTARIISRFRLGQDILAVTPDKRTAKRLDLYYGVRPVVFNYGRRKDGVISVAKRLSEEGLVGENDLLLFSAGLLSHEGGSTNLIQVHRCRDLLKYKRQG